MPMACKPRPDCGCFANLREGDHDPRIRRGLETFFQSRQASIVGILNGIDQENWDPAQDAISR